MRLGGHTIQERCPNPLLVTSGEAVPLPLTELRHPSSQAGWRLDRDARPPAPLRREPLPDPLKEVDFPVCSPHPILSLFQVEVSVGASSWWSRGHVPALCAREAGRVSAASGRRAAGGGTISRLGTGIPETGSHSVTPQPLAHTAVFSPASDTKQVLLRGRPRPRGRALC